MKTLIPLLSKIADRNSVGSAYIFVGVDAEISKTQARLFAQRLNCMNDGACMKCNSCQKIERGVHPDIYNIESQSGVIKIEAIRELQKKLHLKPYEGKVKVVIINSAQDLQRAASNSMLKILEEPPRQTVFLLLTPHRELLLPTIISRCHTVRVHVQQLSLPESEYLNQMLSLSQAPHSKDELFTLAKEITKEDDIFKDCLEIWLAWYRTVLFYKQGIEPNEDYFKEKAVLAQNVSSTHTTAYIHKKIDAILETKKNLQYQVNRELLAENLLLTLAA